MFSRSGILIYFTDLGSRAMKKIKYTPLHYSKTRGNFLMVGWRLIKMCPFPPLLRYMGLVISHVPGQGLLYFVPRKPSVAPLCRIQQSWLCHQNDSFHLFFIKIFQEIYFLKQFLLIRKRLKNASNHTGFCFILLEILFT